MFDQLKNSFLGLVVRALCKWTRLNMPIVLIIFSVVFMSIFLPWTLFDMLVWFVAGWIVGAIIRWTHDD